MPKRLTVRFYTERKKYMGWKYFNLTVCKNEVINWIRSGNHVYIGTHKYYWLNRHKLSNLLAMLEINSKRTKL